jgi:hypothetical protein
MVPQFGCRQMQNTQTKSKAFLQQCTTVTSKRADFSDVMPHNPAVHNISEAAA